LTGATPQPIGTSQPGAWVPVTPARTRRAISSSVTATRWAIVTSSASHPQSSSRSSGRRPYFSRAIATSTCSFACVRRRSPWFLATSPSSSNASRESLCTPAGPTASCSILSSLTPPRVRGSSVLTIASAEDAAISGSSPADPRTKTSRPPSERAEPAIETAIRTLSISGVPAQLSMWSATVVTPLSRPSATPILVEIATSSGSTPTRTYADAIAGSHSAIGTPRVPGRVRKALCSRWWWALTRPGVMTWPLTSRVSCGLYGAGATTDPPSSQSSPGPSVEASTTIETAPEIFNTERS
jgi:hypothetical protein